MKMSEVREITKAEYEKDFSMCCETDMISVVKMKSVIEF